MDAPFWGEYITRMSISVPAIYHAVVALSASHEGYLFNGNGSRHKVYDRHEQLVTYSREKYGKAIQTLNLHLCNTLDDRKMIEETLVACLLFICFEILQGEDVAALTHLEGGLQIFGKLCGPQTGASVSQKVIEDSSVSSLASMFSRFDIQASSFMGSRPVKSASSMTSDVFPQPELSITRALLSTRVEDFVTVLDARENLDILLAYVYQFLRSIARDCQYLPHLNPYYDETLVNYASLDCFPVTKSILTDAHRQRDIYIGFLRTWNYKFKDLLERQSRSYHLRNEKNSASERHRECVGLQLTYLVTLIKLSTSLDPNETAYDHYMPQFKAIVTLADGLLIPAGNAMEKPKEDAPRTFALQMNVIHPLHFTAVKCRDYTLRRRAVSLLKLSGKEGVWDGEIMAKMAEHVIFLEEEDMELGPDRDEGGPRVYVSEYARVHGVGFDMRRITRTAIIDCSRRIDPGDSKTGQTRWRNHIAEISW